ncbi:hydantoinase/oxoprolinase family protein [Candidatus Poriferisocius sp.]|uniref:hydantoinase/oxoprolinase family protein n=1 Tax=Candidatus Poriferisocius sp. TaxID=3101276 RepID=UPI003B025A23
MRIGIDTGGTFTDAVVVAPDPDGAARVGVGKALSTSGDLTAGALAAVEAAAAETDQPLANLLGRAESIGYATTVGLNALLTGTGAPIGLITTEGFEATLPVARAAKVAGLSPAEATEAVCWAKPPLLLSRQRIVGVPERIDGHGEVVRPLDEAAAVAVIKALRDDGVTSYAVSLLWSVADPRHEVRIAELIAQIHPGAHVSLSSAVPRIGEYERTMTTVLDASTAPLVAEEIRTLAHALAERGFAGHLHVMQSSGSTCDADGGLRAVETLGSGPVAGLLASAELVQQLGRSEAIATDVGGTSFDVGLITGGEATMATRPMIGRWALAHPMVEVVSIGTGGGSLAWIDPVLGSLRVGPHSAGAQPGPACYRRGGTAPTLTDAAVTLGYLGGLGQVLELDHGAAERALEDAVAAPLGLSEPEAADAVVGVACSQMADLIRRVTVQRGHDPAGFTMLAYGGAAPQYATRYAAEVGVAEVVVPSAASVFSALGAARGKRPAPEPAVLDDSTSEPPAIGRRDAWFDRQFASCRVYDGPRLVPGTLLEGPAFIDHPSTTIVLRPGDRAEVDAESHTHLFPGPPS